jgi:uncharacterized protein YrzB (UPF0473 family)
MVKFGYRFLASQKGVPRAARSGSCKNWKSTGLRLWRSIMSEEYGSDFITITDEEGNEYELELLDSIEIENDIYMAFLPADSDEAGEEASEMIILKVIEENGEELFATVDDEDELENVYEQFMEQMFGND